MSVPVKSSDTTQVVPTIDDVRAAAKRIAAAGGALGEMSDCMTEVDWLTLEGAFVVRLASGGLHAASAAVLAATISAVDSFI